MKEYKLITILKTFSKEEMKNFGFFISSPYFNRTRNYDRLFNFLKKYHPEFPPNKFGSEKIYACLYPGKIYDKNNSPINIRVIFSQLTSLANKFLAYEQLGLGRNSYSFTRSMASAFESKKLLKLALEVHLKNSATIDAQEKDHDYYHHRLRTNQSVSDLYRSEDRRNDHFSYLKNNLLYVYAYTFYELAYFLNDTFVVKSSENRSFKGFELAKSFVEGFDPMLFEKQCESDRFETKNMTLYYYYIIKSRLDENDKESLLNATEAFYRLFPNVSQQIQWYCFIALFNRFKDRRPLDRIYAVKANEIVDYVWPKGILNTEKGRYLEPGPYSVALNIKSYLLSAEGIGKFIDAYVDKVAPQYKADLKDYSMAYLCFKEKLYRKCLEYVSKRDELPTGHKLDKYKLKICAMYEAKLYEEAIYAADSFEHFIRRNNSIGPNPRERNMQFLIGFRHLLKLESGQANGTDFIFTKTLALNRHTIFGDWLIEKLNELESQKCTRVS